MADAMALVSTEGQGVTATFANWTAAILHNGNGCYSEAFAAARKARELSDLIGALQGLPELVEAAVRSGHTQVATDALDELEKTTRAGATEFGLGLEARSRALVTESNDAEGWYREAIDRLGRSMLRPDVARAHLLYGEWLRRQRRRRDARDQLGTAFEVFDSLGMAAFSARARAELRATGERVTPRSQGPVHRLTPQEDQIARLVAQNLSNREIAARLFISASTVSTTSGRSSESFLSLAARKPPARSRTTARNRTVRLERFRGRTRDVGRSPLGPNREFHRNTPTSGGCKPRGHRTPLLVTMSATAPVRNAWHQVRRRTDPHAIWHPP